MADAYLIWSNEHRAWWRPGEHGYTPDLIEAGVYTRERAIAICFNATWGWRPGQPPPEIPVRTDDAQAALSEANTRVQSKR